MIEQHEPLWIVNDLGELGVKIGERFFFLYKGENIEYGSDGKGPVALHDDGTPMKYRLVGKREFGETCQPVAFTIKGVCVPVPYKEELAPSPYDWERPTEADWQLLPAQPDSP
jgi:hypothetical protein